MCYYLKAVADDAAGRRAGGFYQEDVDNKKVVDKM
jgi:hypothetical protein